ncbi:P-loop containing nucleoside triphosphate hydrolase protein [Hesseltinella vesiculosa]|uniref:Origin recognition complex subunit 1 n=1 Tax=Hesseltinella vesiculosa TaxID=101127 RepID=A0A1X2G926_9FUNG|nr:P-loop containing nucleoside triphosphate hydrolase protein [Hesseltinella vesiculosa]
MKNNNSDRVERANIVRGKRSRSSVNYDESNKKQPGPSKRRQTTNSDSKLISDSSSNSDSESDHLEIPQQKKSQNGRSEKAPRQNTRQKDRSDKVERANIIKGKRTRTTVNYGESDKKNPIPKTQKKNKDTSLKAKRRQSKGSDDDSDADISTSDSSSDADSDSDHFEPPVSQPKSRLLATLNKKRSTTARSKSAIKKPQTITKRKMAAASKRSVQRVNQRSTTSLRKVTRSDATLTAYELARERLHVSAVPDSLPCREEEFEEISSYLESALIEGTGTCVYISGVPGTGKTATVLEVIRGMQHRSEENELPPFDFVEINGMKLTDPAQAYSILWECIDRQNSQDRKKRVTSRHALDLLDQNFSNPDESGRTTLVLMDELDLLVTKNQSVMYNFFEWPNRAYSKLIVVAIANTMDLPERMLQNKISSRIGLTRVNFQAYTHLQLNEIVESRLKGIETFEADAVEFAARKVSAVSGDARRALDICRRAVEIVESKQGSVTIAVVNQAIKEMFSSPSVAFIQACSLHQKVFLISVMQRIRQLGIADIEFGDVAQHHLQTCKWHHLDPPTTSDLMRICESLGQSRAILIEDGRLDLSMRVTLNFSEEDVIMACKADRVLGRLVS